MHIIYIIMHYYILFIWAWLKVGGRLFLFDLAKARPLTYRKWLLQAAPGHRAWVLNGNRHLTYQYFRELLAVPFFMNTERFCWKVCITFEVFEAVGLVSTIIPLACGMWKARHFIFRVYRHSISPPRAPKIAQNIFGFWLQTLLKFGWSSNMVHTPHTQPISTEIYTMYTKSCYYQFDNLTCPHYI